MAANPFQHDAVRLLWCLLEDGVTATRQHNEFGGAQLALQIGGGAETDRTVPFTPYQQRWNLLHAVERGF